MQQLHMMQSAAHAIHTQTRMHANISSSGSEKDAERREGERRSQRVKKKKKKKKREEK